MSVIPVTKFWQERDDVISRQKQTWELYEELRNFIFNTAKTADGKLIQIVPGKMMSPNFQHYSEFQRLISDLQASMLYILGPAEIIVGETQPIPSAPMIPPTDRKLQYIVSAIIVVALSVVAFMGASINQTFVEPVLSYTTSTVSAATTTYTTVLQTQVASTIKSEPILSGDQMLLLILFGFALSIMGIFGLDILNMLLTHVREEKKEKLPQTSEEIVSKNLDEMRDDYAGAFGIEPWMRLPNQVAAQLEKFGHTITAGGPRRLYTWKFQNSFPKRLGIVMSVADKAAWQRRSELTKKIMEVSRPAAPPRQTFRQPFQQQG